MSEIPALVTDLALILVVAGVVTLIFKQLKQPLVLGYVVAGFLVSTHMPYTASVVDSESIHLWSDLGVMFLLFSLGLDFSFKKILKMGASPIISTCSIIFCMSMLGVIVGHMFGWSKMDCILAIVMMVLLSAIASGKDLGGGEMLHSIWRIIFFLVLWLVVGIFAIPLFLTSVRKLINGEVLLIVSLGLCCAMAVISTKVGFSSAFGAFIMGSIFAETIEAERIIKLVEPVKNLFGAIFFVSVGMLVDPKIIIDYALPIFALVMTILVGQAIFGTIAFMLGGESLKSAMRCGFSMAQIGEFSFIIASLGLSLGVISDFLYPVVVAVSVITTFLTPYMIRFATPVYNNLEKHLPHKIIRSLNHLSMSHPHTTEKSLWKQLLTQMGVNTLVYSILSTAAIALMLTFVLPFMQKLLPGDDLRKYANGLTGLMTIVLIAPFLRAMVMKKNRSEEWKTLWAESNRNRLPLLFTILVRALIALSGIFYVCNYLSEFSSALVITIGVVILVCIILSRWTKHRSITMERLFMLNLRSRDIEAQVHGKKRPLYEGKLLDRDIHIAEFEIPYNSKWMGNTLKQLNLGQKYGVHISSILRGGRRVNIPDGESIIFPGDVLQAIGSDEQFNAFREAIEQDVFGEDTEMEKREMKLRQLIIASDSPFVGKTLRESNIRDHYNCLVIGLEEGKESLSTVKPNYKFETGDILWIVGEKDDLDLIPLHSV